MVVLSIPEAAGPRFVYADVGSIPQVTASAVRFADDLGSVDLSAIEADDLALLIRSLRRVQARVDGLLVQAGVRADALAAEGVGAPARDALVGSGEVRARTARQEAARSQLAARSAELGTAMGSGLFGPDHLDVLVRRLGRLDDEHLGRIGLGSILGRAAGLPADTFDRLVRRSVEAAAAAATADSDETPDEAEQARAESEVTHWFDHKTGMGHLSGRFDPERYEAIANAIDQHTSSMAAGHDDAVAKNANLAAAALFDLVCGSGGRQRHLPLVNVVVDHQTLVEGRHSATVAETADGHGLADDAVARLCCDAVLRRVVLDEQGVPIDVGRRHRTATGAQWSALRSVHSSCAWHGCDRPLSQCQVHHVRYWRHGGRTDLKNLVPLCSHHHHLVHEGGWQVELLADRSLHITRPDGRPYATTDPPSRRPPPTRSGPVL